MTVLFLAGCVGSETVFTALRVHAGVGGGSEFDLAV